MYIYSVVVVVRVCIWSNNREWVFSVVILVMPPSSPLFYRIKRHFVVSNQLEMPGDASEVTEEEARIFHHQGLLAH